MIVEIEGAIGERHPGYVVIHTSGGLGYGVEVPRETDERLPLPGDRVRLFTHLIVREDQWRLIGFSSGAEREVFRDLLEVNGVGIKGALSVMSHLGVDHLRQAVLTGEWKALKQAPGIGAKIAQRIQLELMSRWLKSAEPGALPGPVGLPAAGGMPERTDEVVMALTSLGYQVAEAEAAVAQVSAEAPEERLRLALKALDRGRR